MDRGEPLAITDAGADADGQQDLGDSDADMSEGGDSDTDGDVFPPVETDERAGAYNFGAGDASICRNNDDEDGDGLFDCADLGCLGDPLCCVEAPSSGIEGDFGACVGTGLEACGWTRFFEPSDGDAIRLSTEGVVLLGGDGDGEVGLYSEPLIGLTGQPMLSFEASLQDMSCATGACPQLFGVALTSQQAISTSTGVQPTVGVALDGELRLVHFFANGRIELSQELVSDDALTRPLHYAFQLEPDGEVSFWGQLTSEQVDGAGRPIVLPTYVSPASPATSTREVRVVAFGRLAGADRARLERVDLRRRSCDVPDGWSRDVPYPVLSPSDGTSRAQSPSVFELDGELMMIYERDHGMAAATSPDSGTTWNDAGPILTSTPLTQYGRVAIRSPSVVEWLAPGDTTSHLHLWYVGEAEAGATTPLGVTPTAILHATSDDGLTWTEQDEPIEIEATSGTAWMNEVATPTVVVDANTGDLRMWFVGSAPIGGGSAILTATSQDGKRWNIEEAPVVFELAEGEPEVLPFERDGRGEPSVIERNGVFHMWYEGYDGARTSIGYAVSSDGRRWARFGEVLGATSAWESLRVGGPSVVTLLSEAGTTTDVLQLYYHGGTIDRERVGLVAREVPNWDYLPDVDM